MAINRFYQPQIQQYVSQFVPENLQVVQNQMQMKQNQYNQAKEQLDIYEDMLLKQKALEGFDTEQLKEVRKEFDAFNEGLLGKDLGDPSVARDASRFIRNFQRDERIQKLNEGLALKAKHDEIVSKYKTEKDAHAYATENELEWLDAWSAYKNQTGDGQKFAAEFLRGKETVDRGIDIRAEEKKYFDDARVRGGEQLLKTIGGTYYEKGVKGISKAQIDELAGYGFSQFQQSNAAQQLRRRYDLMKRRGETPRGLPSRDSKGNIIQGEVLSKEEYVLDDFLRTGYEGIGETVDYQGRYSALNTDRTRQEEQATAFWENGTTQGPLANYTDRATLDADIIKLESSQNSEDVKKAALLKNSRAKLDKQFVSRLSGDAQKIMKIDAKTAFDNIRNNENLTTEQKRSRISEYVNNMDIGQITTDVSNIIGKEDLIDQILTNNEAQFIDYNKTTKELQKYAADKKGIDFEDINKKRDEFITKDYVEESADILLGTGKGDASVRANTTKAMQTYVNDINFDVIGSKRTTEELLADIDPQSVKIRVSSTGPVIVFKTKGGTSSDNIDPEVITLKHKTTGQQNAPDRGIVELYRTLTGGDPNKFGKVMLSHTYADIVPMVEGNSYNALDDTKRLNNPYINAFLAANNAETVEYIDKGDEVGLKINGIEIPFTNDAGEELEVKDVPTLMELIKLKGKKTSI